MKCRLRILKKQKSFQETQISFPKCIEHHVFLDPQLQPLGGFWVSLNYPILDFQENGIPKKRLDAALESLLKMMKNAFYFILKAFFVLKIFKILF